MFFQLIFGELNAFVLLLEFLCAAALVVFTGVKVSALADELGDKLGFNKAWIGIAVLSLITSQPAKRKM